MLLDNYEFEKTNLPGLGAACLHFSAGASMEYPGVFGATHILEHLLCRDLKAQSVALRKKGLSFNAFTAHSQMMFYIKGLERGLIDDGFYKLLTAIPDIPITREDFLREKEIVRQEFEMTTKGQTINIVLRNYALQQFNEFPVDGSIQNLSALTFEKFMEYREYYLANTRISCKIIASCNPVIAPSRNNPLRDDLAFSYDHDLVKNEMLSGELLPVEQTEPVVVCAFSKKRFQVNALEDVILDQIATNMLCDGFGSPLFDILREERKLCYHIYFGMGAADQRRLASIDFAAIAGKEKVKDIISGFFETAVEKFDRHFTQERFEDVSTNYLVDQENLRLRNFDDIKRAFSADEAAEKELLKRLREKSLSFAEIRQMVLKHLRQDAFTIVKSTDFLKK